MSLSSWIHDNSGLVAFILSIFFSILFCLVYTLYHKLIIRGNSTENDVENVVSATTATGQINATGLSPKAISALTSFAYNCGCKDGNVGIAQCAVCLNFVADGEFVKVLPNCKHLFHVGCIDMWLCLHSTCPICRSELKPKPLTEFKVDLPIVVAQSPATVVPISFPTV